MNCEWDTDKAKANLRKHTISFEEACSVFSDPILITVLDEEHSFDEDRYITIGLSNQNRLILVAHAERRGVIRIISARKVTKNEQKFYTEGQ